MYSNLETSLSQLMLLFQLAMPFLVIRDSRQAEMWDSSRMQAFSSLIVLLIQRLEEKLQWRKTLRGSSGISNKGSPGCGTKVVFHQIL